VHEPRDATDDDVERIVALVESAYRGESSRAGWTTEAHLLDGQRTDVDAVSAALRSSTSRILVVDDARGDIVGCCQLDARPDGRCHFGLFAVAPTLQGGGVGGRLLETAEAAARSSYGAGVMELTVIAQRTDLIAWYERRGYRRTGETRPFHYGDERFGRPRRDDLYFVVLEKPLAT
jgi:ribosomal protein S18 acetylase RimI-like enzyme